MKPFTRVLSAFAVGILLQGGVYLYLRPELRCDRQPPLLLAEQLFGRRQPAGGRAALWAGGAVVVEDVAAVVAAARPTHGLAALGRFGRRRTVRRACSSSGLTPARP